MKPDCAQARNRHPSRSLKPRARGYGIGGGYERPYRKPPGKIGERAESYGPLPHSGYYGAGSASTRFKHGQAGFKEELLWYGPQYGQNTSGRDNSD
ncbi:MAG TPA: hypothetical protein VLM38_02005 [Blastocatellia bacterium]|nr:hypothetical protein [Blastocatellia bacterium]